ncbi:gag-pol fusion protein [Lasius niger]|uniref:RNA-directed DNA polymerase n=1 Tax=Lasius niger TaxID=67767 RepID=A0A0J7JX22_LASNI|nr:gag-pol fusion protein [Lasius niger]
MLEEGYIEPSESPWAAPIVLVKKKNGDTRFCVDYRGLNNVTKSDSFPLPLIQSIVQRVGQATTWSTLDLAAGYWQVRVAPEDRPKTAFVTPHGTFQYCVMPFGLKNAPATFQRLMNKVLAPFLGKFCEVYLDDIVIHSQNEEEHIGHLRQVLRALQKAGLVLNVEKSKFFKRELDFLGHHFTQEGLKPQEDKLEAIKNYPRPRNVKALRRFLGMCSWIKNFIPKFAEKAKPLYELTRPSHGWRWGDGEQRAFDLLKHALLNPPVLQFFKQEGELFLYTDASEVGLGATITQKIGDQERILGYASRVLSSAETNYSVSERECLAIVWACEKLKDLLFNSMYRDYRP